MSFRTIIVHAMVLPLGTMAVAPVSAALIATLHPGSSFPTAAEFQTFDPTNPGTPTAAERTLTGTRNLTQTFELASSVNVDEIDIMYVRGSTASPTGRVRIFPVANTIATDITTDFNNAVTNGFLLDETFTMPLGLSDNIQRTLRLLLSSPLSLPASTSPAGYALNLSVPNGTSELFTWRFGDPGTGSGQGWYANGNIFHDAFTRSGTTQGRRDGLFALNGDVTGPVIPEPATCWLFVIGASVALVVRRK